MRVNVLAFPPPGGATTIDMDPPTDEVRMNGLAGYGLRLAFVPDPFEKVRFPVFPVPEALIVALYTAPPALMLRVPFPPLLI